MGYSTSVEYRDSSLFQFIGEKKNLSLPDLPARPLPGLDIFKEKTREKVS